MRCSTRPTLLAIVLIAVTAGLVAPVGDDVAVTGEAILAPSAAVTALGASTPGPACTDRGYSLAPWHLTGTFRWYYNPVGAPASVASNTLTTLQAASEAVADGRNRCGVATALGTSQQYVGTTSRAAGISAAGTCTGDDGYSVTSWGTLPPSYLAYTCVYYNVRTGVVVGSDLLLDSSAHRWFTTLSPGCVNAYDLQTVAVHERGHTAGLAHVSQLAHGIESMSPTTLSCDISERLLALGDLTGLERLYTTNS
jgi:Matrixin